MWWGREALVVGVVEAKAYRGYHLVVGSFKLFAYAEEVEEASFE